MILADFKDFIAALPPTGQLLGIDWGAKRIGVAISDVSREFVFVRPQIDNRPWSRAAAAEISEKAKADGVVGIIIGLPLWLDGGESETSAAVRQFAKDIAAHIDIPITFVDEGLTSRAAEEELVSTKKSTIKQKLDSQSAKIILEDALSKMKRIS